MRLIHALLPSFSLLSIGCAPVLADPACDADCLSSGLATALVNDFLSLIAKFNVDVANVLAPTIVNWSVDFASGRPGTDLGDRCMILLTFQHAEDVYIFEHLSLQLLSGWRQAIETHFLASHRLEERNNNLAISHGSKGDTSIRSHHPLHQRVRKDPAHQRETVSSNAFIPSSGLYPSFFSYLDGIAWLLSWSTDNRHDGD